jgi:hypothetical protein
MSSKPLLGLLILAVPVWVIWWLMRNSKGPRTGETNHEDWYRSTMGGGSNGGAGGSDGGADGSQ